MPTVSKDRDRDHAMEDDDLPPAKRLDKGKGKATTNGSGKSNSDDANLPWVEKYRPKELDQVVSHQDIIATSECSLESYTLVF